MSLERSGSCDMYSVEYKWTKNDIKVTKTHIEAVILSNINHQSTFKISEFIQVLNFIYIQNNSLKQLHKK